MKNLLRKLTSRKLWAAAAGIAVGAAAIFGVDADTISRVAGAVMTMASVMAYIVTEGKIDAVSAVKPGMEPDEAEEMEGYDV